VTETACPGGCGGSGTTLTTAISTATTPVGYGNSTLTTSKTSTATPVQVSANAAPGNVQMGCAGLGMVVGVVGFVGGML
jgi:hypothetical protein